MKELIEKIHKSKSFILSTHQHCDGDGIGAQLALYHALKSINKNVRVLNYDKIPTKYHYLEGVKITQEFDTGQFDPLQFTDLVLIFDTNDYRLLGPLYNKLNSFSHEIIFIDHHPRLTYGPEPTNGSYIDANAASTGEIVFNLIRKLGIKLDTNIAEALYTSIAFDTQLFRYIRNSPASHEIAAELLRHNLDTEKIHRSLFGDQTINKMAFMSKVLGGIEYYAEAKIALINLSVQDLLDHGLEWHETRDIVDLIMNIETIEIAALIREDEPNGYKVSIRSKGKVEVLQAAEKLGGGGHNFSSGAFFKGQYEDLKNTLINELSIQLKKVS